MKVFSWNCSMELEGVQYSLGKSSYADREIWANMIFDHHDQYNVTRQWMLDDFDKYWSDNLSLVHPISKNASGRGICSFKINGETAGMLRSTYSCGDKASSRRSHNILASLLGRYKNRGHYKIMHTLGTYHLSRHGYAVQISVIEDAEGTYRELVRNSAMNLSETVPARADGSFAMHKFVGSSKNVMKSILSDTRFGEIVYESKMEEIEDAQWAQRGDS